MENVGAIILAGGLGKRLSILAQERAKPALPFAGKYRIIDFALSNCVNSGICDVAVVTQYQPRSLIEHIGIGAPWGLVPPDREIQLLQPYLAREEGHEWYKGTADAVYENFRYIEKHGAELIFILSGDHVYKMDYSDMLKFHREKQADLTLAVTSVPDEELRQFGTVIVDEAGQVIEFQEKVKHPKSNFVSMGIYLFNKDVLQKCLEEDAESKTSKHDFGKNVIPRIVKKGGVFAYSFDGYWRDVGTVDSYWQANMDLLEISPYLLLSAGWPLRTKIEDRPPAMVSERVIGSLLSHGCVIRGRVEHSILSPGVQVAEGAIVKDSIIMSDSIIGPDSIIDYAILDKEVVVEAGCHIGFGDNFQANHKNPAVLNAGLTVVGKRAQIPAGIKIGRNCVIFSNAFKGDFPGNEIQSGETVKSKRRRTH